MVKDVYKSSHNPIFNLLIPLFRLIMKLPCPYLQNASQRKFLPIFNTYCNSKT